VDVWVNFQNGEQVEQLEDQDFRGKITARYVFKGGQVVGQEQVADGAPPSAAATFGAVEDEVRSMATYGTVPSGTVTARTGMAPGGEIK